MRKQSTTQPAGLDFEIENLGGISHLPIRLEPGVNELEGVNGAGKTSAIRAIERACGSPVPLEVKDGEEEGSVRGGGVQIIVRKVAKATGKPEVEIAGGSELADLIDGGGFKDSDARAKCRIRALLRLVQLPVTEETIGDLAADPEVARIALRDIQDNLIDDLLEAAEKVRRTAHSLARAQEERQTEALAVATVHDGQISAAALELGGASNAIEIPAADAEANLARLRESLGVIRMDAQRRRELEAQQAEIKASIGDRPDPRRFDAAKAELEDSAKMYVTQIADLNEQRREIEAKIERATQGLGTAKRDLQALDRRIAEAESEAAAWDQRAGVLARPIEGPVAADVERAERAVEIATETTRKARISEALRRAKADGAEARERADAAAQRGEFLRTIATTVQDRLGELLNRTDAAGLTVEGGRLCVVERGKVHDFETRRSEGQRIDAALRVAARTFAGKVVALDGRYWTALDPEHREHLAKRAVQYGLYLITERASDCALRVNHLTGAEAVAAEAV